MKEFLSKHKALIYEILRYLLVGGLATIIDFACYEICRYLIFKSLKETANIILSTACGFFLGNIFNYIFSILFVFKGAKDNKKTQSAIAFLTFTIISLFGLAIKIGCQTGGNYLIHLIIKTSSPFWSWLVDTFVYAVSTLIVLIWNYVCKKLIIFKGKSTNEIDLDI